MDDLGAKAFIIETLRLSPNGLPCLEAVRALALPDAWIGAGFLRNRVWDRLHDHQNWTSLNDIDVVYFDRSDLSKNRESELEATLAKALPGHPWSVRNQARMHKSNGFPPFKDTADALAHWVETATAVAARLNDKDEIELLAPCGLQDLVTLHLRPTPAFEDRSEVLLNRAQAKNWLATWPKIQVKPQVENRFSAV